MKAYFIESYRGWFVIKANNKKDAKREGVAEFGNGCVKDVREATEDEIKYYTNVKGEIGEAW